MTSMDHLVDIATFYNVERMPGRDVKLYLMYR